MMLANYKKIFKSRKTRHSIIRALNWVPDEIMIRIQYKVKTGRSLNLSDPQRFTEKLQWYKLFYRDPLMATCADKAAVRSYVQGCDLGNTLAECYGIYDSPDDIDFTQLPKKFVLKDSLGGGNNEVIVCEDRARLDSEKVKSQLTEWVAPSRHRKHPGREWVYDTNKPSCIIAEEYLEPESDEFGLIDYKFFFFNGESKYLYVLCDRQPGAGGQLGVYTTKNFGKTLVQRADERVLNWEIPKPPNYDEMLHIATKLAEPFPHVRVDLYDLGPTKGVRFGELTFFDGSGYFFYEPDEFDFEMGNLFKLPRKKENK